MQLYHNGILGLDFTSLCDDDVSFVLAMRNDERVAGFMYSGVISEQAHKAFIAQLATSSSAKYWLFKLGEIPLGVGSLSRISLRNQHAYIGIYTNPFLTRDKKLKLYECYKRFCDENAHHNTSTHDENPRACSKLSVGGMILSALEQAARDIGLSGLYLEVLDSNTHAKSFYERYHYTPQGILKNFIRATSDDDKAARTDCAAAPLDSTATNAALLDSASKGFIDVCVYGKRLVNAASLDSALESSTLESTITPHLPHQTHIAQKPQTTHFTSSSQYPSKPLLVAEISANHNHNLNLAKRTIRAAKIAGADYVKLQTYTPECLSIACDKSYFRIDSGTLWDGESLYDLYKKAYTPFEWHKELFAYARELGVGIFSSPFSAAGLELLESLECPMYKIASFEITDTPFIQLVASTKKPIIISTGIATHEQIVEALRACYDARNTNITLLLCTSSYPAPLDSAAIAAMPKLARYGVRYGLSDHTQGDVCALLACALGASMIEKHFIIKRSLGGVDAEFSMEAREFQALARKLESSALALGDGDLDKRLESNAHASAKVFARSLFVCADVKQGEILTHRHIRSIRPSHGILPKFLPDVIGKKATKDLYKGEPLKFGDFA